MPRKPTEAELDAFLDEEFGLNESDSSLAPKTSFQIQKEPPAVGTKITSKDPWKSISTTTHRGVRCARIFIEEGKWWAADAVKKIEKTIIYVELPRTKKVDGRNALVITSSERDAAGRPKLQGELLR